MPLCDGLRQSAKIPFEQAILFDLRSKIKLCILAWRTIVKIEPTPFIGKMSRVAVVVSPCAVKIHQLHYHKRTAMSDRLRPCSDFDPSIVICWVVIKEPIVVIPWIDVLAIPKPGDSVICEKRLIAVNGGEFGRFRTARKESYRDFRNGDACTTGICQVELQRDVILPWEDIDNESVIVLLL